MKIDPYEVHVWTIAADPAEWLCLYCGLISREDEPPLAHCDVRCRERAEEVPMSEEQIESLKLKLEQVWVQCRQVGPGAKELPDFVTLPGQVDGSILVEEVGEL